MKDYAIVPLIMATVSLTFGISDFLTWVLRRGRPYHVSFAVTCFVVALFAVACSGEYNIDTPAQSLPWLKAQAVLLNLAGICLLWYLYDETGKVSRRIFLVFIVWCGLGVLVQVLNLGNLTWISGSSLITDVPVPGLGHVVYLELEAGPITIVQNIAALALLGYSLYVVFAYSRAGHKKEARFLMVATGVIIAAFLNDYLVTMGVYSFIYTMEYCWSIVIITVGTKRGQQALQLSETRSALAEIEQRYRNIFVSLQDVYFRCDSRGIVSLVSPSVEKVFGYRAEAIQGWPWVKFLAQPRKGRELQDRIIRHGDVSDAEFTLRGPDSRRFEVSLSAHLSFQNGKTGMEGMIRDISERIRSQREIVLALQEKEVLLSEVHHRVKNNLQIISSLLHLQELKTNDPAIQRIIQDCRNQIFSMAEVHEDLYRSGDFENIDFGSYLVNLVRRLFSSFGNAARVAFVPKVETIRLRIDQALPCGLIANELCSNALRHAFPEGFSLRRPEVRVSLRKLGDSQVELAVSDSGAGLPPDFDIGKGKGFGHRIVVKLTEQLKGSLTLGREAGTTFTIVFPIHN